MLCATSAFLPCRHCWRTPWHPDPRGETIIRFADAVIKAQKERVTNQGGQHHRALPNTEMAVFYDWCSLFQKEGASSGLQWNEVGAKEPVNGKEIVNAKLAEALQSKTAFAHKEWDEFGINYLKDEHFIKSGDKYFTPAGTRTSAQEHAFKDALDLMQIWYAHQLVTVFLMTETWSTAAKQPKGWIEYYRRGWPTFESAVSKLAKSSSIDVWPLVVDVGSNTGTCLKPPPPTSAMFAEQLKERTFTNGADAEKVNKLFIETTETLLGCAKELVYEAMGWGCHELKLLCEWLPRCSKCEKLSLFQNPKISDEVMPDTAHTQSCAACQRTVDCTLTHGMIAFSGCAFVCSGHDRVLRGHFSGRRSTQFATGSFQWRS